ncbi:MAG: Rpn family recombination-promoting nuclease/putative transposase [Ruminococcus sp.]|jgi:predicted transposase/invertase (TIGR01784 family)|nr:Rpn family recombination-promoting nuclease/putative transposase [Ruminococcus sp.]
MLELKTDFIPCHDVVFSLMFEDSELFKELVKSVTGKDIELIDEPFSQVSKRERVTLSSIRFDLFAKTTQGVFSIDMQRRVDDNLVNRIIFYACRMISSQDVSRMQYSSVLPANVSFIMSEKESSENKNAVRYVKTAYTDTGEPFSDLLNIALVYVPTVLKTTPPDSAIHIFSEFFSIKEINDAENFENKYKNNDLGVKLMERYNTVVFNEEALKAFAKEPYFTDKYTEERNKEIIRELSPIVPLEKLASALKLSLSEVKRLAEL